MVDHDTPGWVWILSGKQNAPSTLILDDIYNTKGKGNPQHTVLEVKEVIREVKITILKTVTVVKKVDYEFLGVDRLNQYWRFFNEEGKSPLFDEAEKKAEIVLQKTAKPVLGSIWTEHTLNFMKAFFRMVVSEYFKVIDEEKDDRFQVHMRSDSFFGFGNFALSMKMGNGQRNYIQKRQGENLRYDCIDMWHEGKQLVTLNILSFHPAHFETFETVK